MEIFKRVDEAIGYYFDSGDPEVKSWFLIKQNSLPFLLCGTYLLFVTMIGPAMMRNRKPLVLRKPMILYNLFIAISYLFIITLFFLKVPILGYDKFCHGIEVRTDATAFTLASCAWYFYVLKYVAFIQTIFFILRKKDHSLTKYHIIHHTVMPLFGWILMRTERSGFASIPLVLNGIAHIIAFTYYGIAAMGPHVKKYLWWKKYLNALLIVQFVLTIFFVAVISPLSGCNITNTSLYILMFGAVLLLVLFFWFYIYKFIKREKEN